MSWSLSFEVAPGLPSERCPEAITAVIGQARDNGSLGNNDCEAERDAAVVEACETVEVLLSSGVLGDTSERTFGVVLSGHCNPNNKPREGYSGDFVNISIVQKS